MGWSGALDRCDRVHGRPWAGWITTSALAVRVAWACGSAAWCRSRRGRATRRVRVLDEGVGSCCRSAEAGIGETFELPGWSAHVSGAAEDDAVGDGQHVLAGPVDYSLLVDADPMHLRVSDARAVADRLGQAPGVSRSRMRDDSYRCHLVPPVDHGDRHRLGCALGNGRPSPVWAP
jgi:hypothetical protein